MFVILVIEAVRVLKTIIEKIHHTRIILVLDHILEIEAIFAIQLEAVLGKSRNFFSQIFSQTIANVLFKYSFLLSDDGRKRRERSNDRSYHEDHKKMDTSSYMTPSFLQQVPYAFPTYYAVR